MMVKADDNLKGRPWMFPSKRQEMGNPSCQKQLPFRDRKHSTHQTGDDLSDGFLIASISVVLNSTQ